MFEAHTIHQSDSRKLPSYDLAEGYAGRRLVTEFSSLANDYLPG